MEQKIVATGPSPKIVIEAVQGDLHLMGWEQPEILARTRSDGNLKLEQQGDAVVVVCSEDCVMRVPAEATLDVRAVGGDARVKVIKGALVVGKVSGDCGLHSVGQTVIEVVCGDLVAKSVAGDLRADQVLGDALVRDVQGQLALGAVSGDVRLAGAGGGIIASASGDATASFTPVAGRKYQINAGGDMSVRVPGDANAVVTLTSGAREIRVKARGVSNGVGKGTCQVTLGAGGAEMTLGAGGSLLLVSEAAESPAGEVNERMETDFARMGEMIGRRAQEAALRAAAHAEAKAQHAAHKAARKAERMAERIARDTERQARAGTRHWNRGFRVDLPFGQPPAPARPSVSDEERLMVLRMVEQKKITIEQAEQLLAALEGRNSS